jgi:ribonuclease P protein component
VSDKGRRQRFGRMDRLRARSSFLAVQHRGRRVPGQNLVLYVLPQPRQDQPARARMGLVVSKKVGNAVVRNRVKRWLREGYRRLDPPTPAGLDLVFIARPGEARSSYGRTAREMADLMRRVGTP